MNHSTYIAIVLLIFLIIKEQHNKEWCAATKIRNSKQEVQNMVALAKRFIGKECLIYLFGGNQISGVIHEVSDSAVLVENKGMMDVVNLEFVTRIREYPRKKNGKKKSLVLD